MKEIEKYYLTADEDKRLLSRHGLVEYQITMHYIQEMLDMIKTNHKCIQNNMLSILDIGAGTGRYSIALSEQGYDVTAIELLECNIEKMKKKKSNVKLYQGNAMFLNEFACETYDFVLMLGPMYHIFGENNKIQALSEALRVLKPEGIMMISYCMNEFNIVVHGFAERRISEWIYEKKLSDDFHFTGTEKDVFDYVRLEDIDRINGNFNIERIKILSPDGSTDYIRSILKSLSEEELNVFIKYQLSICERPDLIGAGSSVIDIILKKQ